MQHRIRKQVMDLTIRGRLDAFRTQHLAGPFYYRQVLPALEKIFDELSGEGENISLDTLELDLGIIPLRDLEAAAWNGAWETVLREQISTALREQGKHANLQHVSVNQNICRQWLFYMERGYLDWNANRFHKKDLMTVLEIFATDYSLVVELRRLIQKSQEAQVRIIRSHGENFLVSLTEILTATTQGDLPQALNELITYFQLTKQETSFTKSSSQQIRQQVWIKIMQIVARRKPGLQTTILIKMILTSEKNLPPITPEQLNEFATLKTIYPVLKVVQLRQQVRSKQRQFEKDPGKNISNKKPQEITPDQYDDIDASGIFVAHAGLVLLHPFYSILFKKLNLVSEGKFPGPVATEKAIHILHYIATGKTNSEEHELVVPKLLCALPLHHALKENIELTEEEKNEADNMLEAAIEKWEKLQNVSIDALRENFLQRSGKLYTKNDMRYLQVEAGSLDVLLDYLPWTLSLVKLPWMKELLRIEWR